MGEMNFVPETFLAMAFDLSRLVTVGPMCAYIDPGAGSLIFQVVLGSALAGLVAIKMFWGQLKVFTGRLIGRKSGNADAQPPEKKEPESDRQERDIDV